eukprot:4326727-Prorocentrum_lima.AAC.1
MPACAHWGQQCLTSMLHAWWKAWRRQSRQRDAEDVELAALARSTTARQPSARLRRWLAHLSWH